MLRGEWKKRIFFMKNKGVGGGRGNLFLKGFREGELGGGKEKKELEMWCGGWAGKIG